MNNQELVSVIMPLYNCQDYVSTTIESVINQTYNNWELIIIDDKSTDNSLEVVKKIMQNEKRIKLIRSEINEGAARARNKGIRVSKGKYIAFLDSDDIWENTKLEKQIDFMKKRNASFSFTAFKRDYYNGKVRVFNVPKKVTYYSTLLKNSICNSTVVIDVSKLGKTYYPDIRKRQDYGLWLKILREKTKYAHGLNEVLTIRNVRKQSVSSNKLGLIQYQWRLYREYEKFSIVTSALLVIKDIFIKLLNIK